MKKSLIVGFSLLAIVTFLDVKIFNFILGHKANILDVGFGWFTHLGEALIVIFLVTIILLKSKRNYLPLMWSSLFIALGITWFLKMIIGRPRPLTLTETDSFPSGHTTAVFATLLIMNKAYPKLKYVWLVFILLIAYSRLYLGVHYPTDVVAGGLIGYFSGVFILQKQNFIKKKIFDPIRGVLRFQ